MFKKTIQSSLILSGIFPFKLYDPDQVTTESKTVQNALEDRKLIKETGWNRLYFMYSRDEFGNLSPELNSSLQVGFLGTFIGALYGGVNKSKIAYLNFIENNQATTFRNHFDAKKKLQDQVTIAFARGAYKWGWRLGFFSMSYILITTSMSVYRGKSSILEYIVGGAVTGTLYKFTLGPRGMIVGGLLGGVLGACGGCVSLAVLKLTGMSMEDVRYWQYQFHTERNEKYRELIKAHNEKDIVDIVKEHNKKTANEQISLESIDVHK